MTPSSSMHRRVGGVMRRVRSKTKTATAKSSLQRSITMKNEPETLLGVPHVPWIPFPLASRRVNLVDERREDSFCVPPNLGKVFFCLPLRFNRTDKELDNLDERAKRHCLQLETVVPLACGRSRQHRWAHILKA